MPAHRNLPQLNRAHCAQASPLTGHAGQGRQGGQLGAVKGQVGKAAQLAQRVGQATAQIAVPDLQAVQLARLLQRGIQGCCSNLQWPRPNAPLDCQLAQAAKLAGRLSCFLR